MSLDLEPATGQGGTSVLDQENELDVRREWIDGKWVPKHPLTPPEETERKGHEWIDGQWVEKPMSTESGIVEINLGTALNVFARASNLGVVISSAGRYKLFADQNRIREPDLSFIRRERKYTRVMTFPPDLAVEVISPSDVAENVETKLDEYLRAGVRLIWFVYVPTRNVWAYRPDGTARLYRAADTLQGEDVLPGFTMPVADVFVEV